MIVDVDKVVGLTQVRKISGKLGDGIKSIAKKKDKDTASVDRSSESGGGSGGLGGGFLASLRVKDELSPYGFGGLSE